MPKAKQKSSLSLSSDFKKKKTKLGKGKQQAGNATDTSFKSRSIALPQQSVNRDKTAAPVTRRNLTLDELIAQIRHYSASVRRDALQGLQELLVAHPALLTRHVGILLASAARLVADEDMAVRKALLEFLSFAFERTSPSLLRPYASTLLLYTTSAMSHIYPDIRVDAVRVADLCLSSLGDVVVQGWNHKVNRHSKMAREEETSEGERSQGHGERMLDCYLNLLGVSLPAKDIVSSRASYANASVTSTDLSPAARLVILRSLTRFLQQTSSTRLSSQDSHVPTWFFESDFSSATEFQWFEKVFHTSQHGTSCDAISSDVWYDSASDMASLLGSAWSQREAMSAMTTATSMLGSDMRAAHSSQQAPEIDSHLLLFESLEPLLLAAFLDCAPSAFPPEGDLRAIQTTSGQLVCVVADLVLTFWRGSRTATTSQTKALGRLLLRMAPYFPFVGSDAHLDGMGRQSDAARLATLLNLSYCELVGLLSVVSTTTPRELRVQLRAVRDYILKALAPSHGGHSVLKHEAFTNLLPTVWLLLSQAQAASSAVEGDLVESLLSYWDGLSLNEPAKQIATEFIGRLVLLPLYSTYIGTFRLQADSPYRPALLRWLTASLPRYLWELGTRSVEASHVALEVLRMVACAGEVIVSAQELRLLQRPLATFFQVRHPQKGYIAGPYARMPRLEQQRATGLVDYLRPLDDALSVSAKAVGASF